MFNNLWYTVEFSSEIATSPKLLKIFDRELVLYRTTDSQIHAIDNTCVHRGAALAMGSIVPSKSSSKIDRLSSRNAPSKHKVEIKIFL